MKVLNFFLIFFFSLFLMSFFSSFFFYSPLLISPLFFLLFFVLLYNIIEESEKMGGFFLAVFLGFISDILSSAMPVGVYVLSFFILAYFVKITVKKYVRISLFT